MIMTILSQKTSLATKFVGHICYNSPYAAGSMSAFDASLMIELRA
jgi:hypothetical protein